MIWMITTTTHAMPTSRPAMKRAVRDILIALRKTPYRRYNTRITQWQAVIEQRLDGRRSGEFSWMRAVMDQVRAYIQALPETERQKLWLETDTARKFPQLARLPSKEFTDVMAPEVHAPVLSQIQRAVRRRERLEEVDDVAASGEGVNRVEG